MPRKSGCLGRYYCFKLTENDEQITCFRTTAELVQYLNIALPTLYLFLKDSNSVKKLKNKNIKIERCRIPVFKEVPNINFGVIN